MIAIIFLVATRQTRDMVKDMHSSSEDLAHTIYEGIKYPMSVGESESVQNEISEIVKNRSDLDILICDFDQKITYSSQDDKTKSKVSDYISNNDFLRALTDSLKTGEHPITAFEDESGDKRYIVTAHPIPNNHECHHCHGSSRKVLGGMIVRKSTEKNYAAIAELRNYNILISIAGICVVTLLMYTILSRLVKQPLIDFTGKIKEMTEKIPEGNYSTRIGIKRRDEIGNLVDSFNHMAETLEMKNQALNKANKDLRNANINLASANKELEAFAYSVSHDLRAPLRGIDGFSKIVLDEYSINLEEDCKHYLNRIRNNALKMSILIDDILTFSKAGRTELLMRQVKLADMVKNVLNDFNEEITSRNISVKIGDLPETNCDITMMQAVFSNLISNSIKFTRKNINAEITIGFDAGKDAVFVRDNGIGFDLQYHDKIFGVFQRLHLPEEYEGTGIGLAIVKRIVERHNGKVWAESQPGKETTFFIKFP